MVVTIAALGAAVALSAAERVGSEIMGQWLIDQGFIDDPDTVFKLTIKAAVKQLKIYIDRALDEQYLDETLDALDALTYRLKKFHLSPQSRITTLDEMDELAADIASRLSGSLGLLGYSSYPVAIGLHLAVLEERRRYAVPPNTEPDDLRVLNDTCKLAFEQMVKWNKENWVRLHESRRFVINSREYEDIFGGSDSYYFYEYAGERSRNFDTMEELRATLETAKHRELEKIVEKYMLPQFDTLRIWTKIFAGEEKALAQRSLDLAPVSVESYDRKREVDQRVYDLDVATRIAEEEAERAAAAEPRRRTALLISALSPVTSD